MNWNFAREVGLPKFIWRRGIIAAHRMMSRKPIRFRLPTGRRISCPCWSFAAQDAFVTDADIDWGSEALFCKYLDTQGDFVDAGANIGYYSAYMAPVVRRVFSFDPDPRNYATLEENTRDAGNIFVHKLALSSQSGEFILELGAESSVSRVVKQRTASDGKTITIPTTTLDAFVCTQRDMRITGIKLDTEGHELPILRGGIETIRRDQPLILTELMRRPGHGDEAFCELAGLARQLNYRLFAFVPRSLGWLRAGRFRLVAMDECSVFSGNATKMVFLVPQRLAASFDCEISEIP